MGARPSILQTDLDSGCRAPPGQVESQLQAKLRAGVNVNAAIECATVHDGCAKHFRCPPIVYALLKGDSATVKLLLTQPKLDPNVYAGWGGKAYLDLQPLHLACALDLTDCVEALLHHGADARGRIRIAGSPWNRTTSIVPAPLKHAKEGDTPLHVAIDHGHSDIIELFLSRKDAPQLLGEKNNKGQTPLFSAIGADRLAVAVRLLRAGADVHVKDETGGTPFQYTLRANRWAWTTRGEYLALLVQHGADVNQLMGEGMTALDYSTSKSWNRVTAALVRLGGLTYTNLQKQRKIAARENAAGSGSSRAGSQGAASSSSSASASASAASASAASSDASSQCVVCLDASPTHGFVHGDVVHCCVCAECWPSIKTRDTCVLCNTKCIAAVRVLSA